MGHQNGIKLGLTVSENMQLAAHLAVNTVEREYQSIFSLLQLSEHQNTRAYYLSAGQRRRLSLAKLFLFPKKLWILDEPLTALDSVTQSLFLSSLAMHLKAGGLGIITSHHPLALKDVTVQQLSLPC